MVPQKFFTQENQNYFRLDVFKYVSPPKNISPPGTYFAPLSTLSTDGPGRALKCSNISKKICEIR